MDDSLRERISTLAQGYSKDLIKLRRDLHRHPETGFDVTRTAGIVERELRSLAGMDVRTGVGGSGVVGDLPAGRDGAPLVALRADMDALEAVEESDTPYRSKIGGKAHLCGHDAHTAMLIYGARIIHELADHLECGIRFIFQPNEETLPGGAAAMIKDGVLEGVAEIYGIHVWPMLECGEVGVRAGEILARPDTFEIEITGVGGHAAMPHKTADPILAGAHLVTALQSIVSRSVDPLEPAVLSVTEFHGGSCDNVIPARVTLTGTVRSFDKEISALMRERLDAILEGVSVSFGVECRLEYGEGYPVTVNHPVCAEKALDAARLVASPEKIIQPLPKVMGGEDFGRYTELIPGCFISLGSGNQARGITHELHHPCFDIDEDCLVAGAALHAAIALSADPEQGAPNAAP